VFLTLKKIKELVMLFLLTDITHYTAETISWRRINLNTTSYVPMTSDCQLMDNRDGPLRHNRRLALNRSTTCMPLIAITF